MTLYDKLQIIRHEYHQLKTELNLICNFILNELYNNIFDDINLIDSYIGYSSGDIYISFKYKEKNSETFNTDKIKVTKEQFLKYEDKFKKVKNYS